MSAHSPDAGQDDSNGAAAARTIPESLACNSCRRAKLRCSRDRPSCSHCRKTGLDCIYETKRSKPGLKAGAVENLHRRLDALEKVIYEQDCRVEKEQAQPIDSSNAYSVLALLAKELPKLINNPREDPPALSHERLDNGCKRRRLEADEGPLEGSASLEDCPSFSGPERLEEIIASYFTHVHPWIPMIHQARFRQRLDHASEHAKLQVVLHAMVIAASKFSKDINIHADTLSYIRKWVVWKAMDEVSPESLQALIILAFTDIGDGHTAKAWSIVGSLTRTVEYSQLTQEQEASETHPFCRPYHFLDNTNDWTEIEERRRIFWNVFNLDRFCSITMGWNTSLTSDDVHRRLPCDGPLWRQCKPVVTPYFGLWDKSAGRIGKPIAFLPQYHSPNSTLNAVEIPGQGDASSGGSTHNLLTDTTVGAFAYCVEATESMSRITSYFLQQKINLRDQREINSWLTRFKELDLRLVHWKMLLPQKWKANMERQSTLMDPNLTTAHVTHNASMILLHQLIAYPPSNWGFRNRLPSMASAEACETSGIEIARITQNYLDTSHPASIIGPQYAFCLFIAGRMLLVHWKHKADNDLSEAFWSLIRSLQEMSRRWTAFSHTPHPEHNLFAKYAARLKELYGMCVEEGSFHIDVMDYTNDIDHISGPLRNGYSAPTVPLGQPWSFGSRSQQVPQPVSGLPLAVPLSPQESMGHNMQNSSMMEHLGSDGGSNSLDLGDFNTIPQMMLDQQFMNMDRVIAFDDGSMFAATMDSGAW